MQEFVLGMGGSTKCFDLTLRRGDFAWPTESLLLRIFPTETMSKKELTH